MSHLFGEKLRFLRVQQHLTQAELAQQLALVTQSHVSYLERGKSSPSLDVAVRAANVFSVLVDYLIRDSLPVEPMLKIADAKSEASAHLFGERLRMLRAESGLTQSELAAKLEPVTQAFISYLEAGRKLPSVEIVIRCADLFRVPCDDLLRNTEVNLRTNR